MPDRIPAPSLTPQTLIKLAIEHLTPAEQLDVVHELIAMNVKLSRALSFSLECSDRLYQEQTVPSGDSITHRAISASLKLKGELSGIDFLVVTLGEQSAKLLIESWGSRADFNVLLPQRIKHPLFIDSNQKPRSEDFAHSGQRSQTSILNALSLEFANPLTATVLCAALHYKAFQTGIDLKDQSDQWNVADLQSLSPLEIAFLKVLRDGVVRVDGGSLEINHEGNLVVAESDIEIASQLYYALGGKILLPRL